MVPPSGSLFLSRGGVSCCCVWGSPRALAARCGCALLGGGSPNPFPPSAAARGRCAQPCGGPSPPSLLRRAPAPSARSGFFLTSSSLTRSAMWPEAPWPSSLTAGPVLAGSLSDASNATLLYSQRGCLPFSVIAPSAPLKCSVRCPAPPSPSAISIASFGSAVLRLCVVPSLPLGPFPLVARAVGGFLSPSPISRDR